MNERTITRVEDISGGDCWYGTDCDNDAAKVVFCSYDDDESESQTQLCRVHCAEYTKKYDEATIFGEQSEFRVK